jgi:hypothetical protein
MTSDERRGLKDEGYRVYRSVRELPMEEPGTAGDRGSVKRENQREYERREVCK